MRSFLASIVLLLVLPAVARAVDGTADQALVFANAYGDTVWFESDSIAPREEHYLASCGGGQDVARYPFYMVARASSGGLAVLLVTRHRVPAPPVATLVESLAVRGWRHFERSAFPDFDRTELAGYESWGQPDFDQARSVRYDSCAGGAPPVRWPYGWGRWPYGWGLHDLSQQLPPPLRLVFVVIGRPVGATPVRSLGSDPAPIVDGLRLRPSDLSSAEVLASWRVAGEAIADFDHRRLRPVPGPGITVFRLDRRTLGHWQ
jgi:hypothetical protein